MGYPAAMLLGEPAGGTTVRGGVGSRTCEGEPVFWDGDGPNVTGWEVTQAAGGHYEPLQEQVGSAQHLQGAQTASRVHGSSSGGARTGCGWPPGEALLVGWRLRTLGDTSE